MINWPFTPTTWTSTCTWYISEHCQEGDQGLDEQKTLGALAEYTWTEEG